VENTGADVQDIVAGLFYGTDLQSSAEAPVTIVEALSMTIPAVKVVCDGSTALSIALYPVLYDATALPVTTHGATTATVITVAAPGSGPAGPTGPTGPAGGSGAPGSSQVLSSPVTATDAGTWYTTETVTPAAGTWLLLASISIRGGESHTYDSARLFDGSAALASAELSDYARVGASAFLAARVVTDGSTTYSLQGAVVDAGGTIDAGTFYLSSAAATYLICVPTS
jgi:hypothetical protein